MYTSVISIFVCFSSHIVKGVPTKALATPSLHYTHMSITLRTIAAWRALSWLRVNHLVSI